MMRSIAGSTDARMPRRAGGATVRARRPVVVAREALGVARCGAPAWRSRGARQVASRARRRDRSAGAAPAACRPPRCARQARRSPAMAPRGLTWSGVTGEMPPQSLMPAAISRGRSPGDRLGGAWMFIAGPRIRRAAAMVQSRSSRSGSAASASLVPGLARKFWTMTSWIWPCWRCRSRIANSASIRSARVSPMPIRMPVVNGTRCFARQPQRLQPRPRAACRASRGARRPARTAARWSTPA